MIEFEKEMMAVLNALNNSDTLPHCVISGSWSMYFYRYIFEGFIPSIATTDLDIFLPSVKKVQNNNISQVLTDLDYIREDDVLSGKTKFYSKDGFVIEFLTIPDKTLNNVVMIKPYNIGAEALPKMAPAGWNYITVDFNGLKVNVVSPVSFVLQKLLINNERKSEYKKLKDLDAIKYVLGFIKSSKKYSEELITSLDSYPKKWKKTILENASNNNIDL